MALDQHNMFLYNLQDLTGSMNIGGSEEENSSTASDGSSQNGNKISSAHHRTHHNLHHHNNNHHAGSKDMLFANRKDLHFMDNLKFAEFQNYPTDNSKHHNSDANPIFLRGLTGSFGQPRRPRSNKKPIPPEQKDNKYFERRHRNNQAAKKSRDCRKMREDEIAMRASQLEMENATLKAQLSTLREESENLKQMWMEKMHKQKLMQQQFANSQSGKLINDLSSFRFLV